MIKKPITIQIPSGLEARPVALLRERTETRQCKEYHGYDDIRTDIRGRHHGVCQR